MIPTESGGSLTMSDLSRLIASALMVASLAITPFVEGCAPAYPSPTASRIASQPTRENASPVSGAGEGDLTSCPTLMENNVKYLHKITDKRNQLTRYIQEHSAENVQYQTELMELSKALAQIDQKILSFRDYTLDPEFREAILADLVQRLADAGRATDALQVANECYKRFPESPYCVAASAEAFHKLGRNIEARAAAERVIWRGPYDAKMEATISSMRPLIGLINGEEQRNSH
jgi:hypothetical protein